MLELRTHVGVRRVHEDRKVNVRLILNGFFIVGTIVGLILLMVCALDVWETWLHSGVFEVTPVNARMGGTGIVLALVMSIPAYLTRKWW